MNSINLPMIINKLWESGGFTLLLDGSCPEFGPNDYIVSMDCFEMTCIEAPSAGVIAEYVARWHPILDQDDHFLGGWISNAGVYYLDISRRIKGRKAAEIMAWKERQQAIYHPASGQSIPIEETPPEWLGTELIPVILTPIPALG